MALLISLAFFCFSPLFYFLFCFYVVSCFPLLPLLGDGQRLFWELLGRGHTGEAAASAKEDGESGGHEHKTSNHVGGVVGLGVQLLDVVSVQGPRFLQHSLVLGSLILRRKFVLVLGSQHVGRGGLSEDKHAADSRENAREHELHDDGMMIRRIDRRLSSI